MEEEKLKFVFTTIDDPLHYGNVCTKENFKILEKWGIIQNMEMIKFRFNLNFDLKDLNKFLKDFFNDKTVRNNFTPINSVEINSNNDKFIEKIKFNKLSTKATNLDLFNILYDNDICNRETGYIRKDFEEEIEEILITDKLKQAMIKEDSDTYCIFNEENRNEFLFHIFRRLVLGGSLCQYEDGVNEYLNMTKLFYKDLVSAAKDPNSNEIVIRSIALEILDIENSNIYRSKGHSQNFLYLIIDPYQKYVHIWYHKWVPFW